MCNHAKTLDPPDTDKLARAFRAVPSLTDTDALTLAKDAFGILVDGLSAEEAVILEQALLNAGVDVEAVDQKDLPELPPAKRLKRADCLPEGLVLYDALNRPSRVAWKHVILLAAGNVRLSDFRRIEKERVIRRVGMGRAVFSIYLTDVRTKEEANLRLVLEFLLDVEPFRYRMEAGGFNYSYLGSRLRRGPVENYLLFARDLLTFGTGATLNRGAAALAEDPPRTFEYPSKHAFEEELVWLLWRSSSASGGQLGDRGSS